MNTKKLVLTALMVAMVSGSAAFAGPGGKGNGNGGGNENSRGARDNGRNTNGAIASELKWRNAGHASAQAFLNANEDSAVGQLATFKNTTQAVLELYAAAGVVAGAELRDPTLIDADILLVQADILLLDPLSGTFDADLAALNAKLAQLEAEQTLPADLVEPLAAEEEAAEVVGIDDLSDAAIDALWDLLEGK